MHAVDRREFEALLDSALDDLPTRFRDRIDNVSFQVEDWPSGDDVRLTGTTVGGTLLGVYRGIPLTHRTTGYNLTTPDVVVLFQEPLQRMVRVRTTSPASSNTPCATKSRTTSGSTTRGCGSSEPTERRAHRGSVRCQLDIGATLTSGSRSRACRYSARAAR